jgi:hypothetical protein
MNSAAHYVNLLMGASHDIVCVSMQQHSVIIQPITNVIPASWNLLSHWNIKRALCHHRLGLWLGNSQIVCSCPLKETLFEFSSVYLVIALISGQRELRLLHTFYYFILVLYCTSRYIYKLVNVYNLLCIFRTVECFAEPIKRHRPSPSSRRHFGIHQPK